jgi:trimeric autotransporter adhesin
MYESAIDAFLIFCLTNFYLYLKLKTRPKHATCPVCRKNVISEEEAQAAQQIQDDIFRPTFLNIIPYPASLSTSSTDLTSNRRYTASRGGSTSSNNSSSLPRTGAASTSRDYSSISSRPPRALSSSAGQRQFELTSTRLGSIRSNNNDDVISLEPFSSTTGSSAMDTGAEANDRRSTLRSNARHLSVHIRRITPDLFNSTSTQTNSSGSASTVPNSTLPSTETSTRTRDEIYRRSARLLNANHLPVRVQSRIVNSSDVPLVPSFNTTTSNTSERESSSSSAIEMLRNRSNRPLPQTNTSSTTTTTTTTTNQPSSASSGSSDFSVRIGQMMEELINGTDSSVRSTTLSNSNNNNNSSSGAQSPPPLIRARANFLSSTSMIPTISVRFGIGNFDRHHHQSSGRSTATSVPGTATTASLATSGNESSSRSIPSRATINLRPIISDDEDQDAEDLFSFALNSLNRRTNSTTASSNTNTSASLLSTANSNNPARIDSRELNERRSEARREQINNERRILRDRLRQATRNLLDTSDITTTTRTTTTSSSSAPPSTTSASASLNDSDTSTFGAAAVSTTNTNNNNRDRNIFLDDLFDFPSPNSSNLSLSSSARHLMNVSGSRRDESRYRTATSRRNSRGGGDLVTITMYNIGEDDDDDDDDEDEDEDEDEDDETDDEDDDDDDEDDDDDDNDDEGVDEIDESLLVTDDDSSIMNNLSNTTLPPPLISCTNSNVTASSINSSGNNSTSFHLSNRHHDDDDDDDGVIVIERESPMTSSSTNNENNSNNNNNNLQPKAKRRKTGSN